MLDDLRHFGTSESWWGRNRDKCVGVACAMLAAYAYTLPDAQQRTAVEEPTRITVQRASDEDCMKLHRGEWLRFQIRHEYAPDEAGRRFRETTCAYGALWQSTNDEWRMM